MRAARLVPAPAWTKPNRWSATAESGMRGGRSGRRASCHAAQAPGAKLALHPRPNAWAKRQHQSRSDWSVRL